MIPPLSIGVIGLGFGRMVHVPAFRADSRCIVSAIGASAYHRARQAAVALGIPKATGDWHELVADPDIQALAIAVPPGIQAEIALAAARAGKHLFCEKPLALNTADAREVLMAAQQSGIVHAMDFIFPEIPAWQRARESLSEVGKIRHVALTWSVETYVHRVRMQHWKTTREVGGGTLNNFVSHTLYYLEWLFGRIACLRANVAAAADGEPRIELWLEFAAGFPATVSVAADAFFGSGHCLEVYGDGGSLRLHNPTSDYARGFALSLATRRTGQSETIAVSELGSTGDGRIPPVSRIVQRFLDAVFSGVPVTPGLREGYRVQQLIDAIRAADRTAREEWVATNE